MSMVTPTLPHWILARKIEGVKRDTKMTWSRVAIQKVMMMSRHRKKLDFRPSAVRERSAINMKRPRLANAYQGLSIAKSGGRRDNSVKPKQRNTLSMANDTEILVVFSMYDLVSVFRSSLSSIYSISALLRAKFIFARRVRRHTWHSSVAVGPFYSATSARGHRTVLGL